MLSLNRKIEEIRQKPEHIRIRYVWGMVVVSMFLIITIWILSVRENFRNLDLRTEYINEPGFQLEGEEFPLGTEIQSELKQLPQESGDDGGSISGLDPEEIGE